MPDESKLQDRTIHEFIRRVREREGANLRRIVLFGSLARNEYHDDSDIDLFVLFEKGNVSELQNEVSDIAYDTDADVSRCQTLLAPFVSTREKMSREKIKIPLFYNIEEEGVVLYDAELRQPR